MRASFDARGERIDLGASQDRQVLRRHPVAERRDEPPFARDDDVRAVSPFVERESDALLVLGEVCVVEDPPDAILVAIEPEREVGETARDAIEALEEMDGVRHRCGM